ncbi:hypothetical protein K505DRAFT_148049 [Melanomma pulvis-pyrius CBS 109.77]|uniref:Uncharacterized protein n=1 Tax=Melanomma pulvis-pyrius CBS 109.77 TaxID=1314802 RepID=A0A6A6WQD2_9PLEO|nr:hypothetical protein K505DRAFT_148049 [Melanomma pulvis-pyrius CBS 109.77]
MRGMRSAYPTSRPSCSSPLHSSLLSLKRLVICIPPHPAPQTTPPPLSNEFHKPLLPLGSYAGERVTNSAWHPPPPQYHPLDQTHPPPAKQPPISLTVRPSLPPPPPSSPSPPRPQSNIPSSHPTTTHVPHVPSPPPA